jgi:hypothetical protein
MKQRLISLGDRLLLRKRAVVETVIDQLKNISQIEHSRHRSPVNCFVNILCGLIAYCHQPKKPGIAMQSNLICSAYPKLTLNIDRDFTEHSFVEQLI